MQKTIHATDGSAPFTLSFKPGAKVAAVSKVPKIPAIAFDASTDTFYSVAVQDGAVVLTQTIPFESELLFWLGRASPNSRADAERMLDSAFPNTPSYVREAAISTYFTR